jgi:hypothetical protein
LERRIVAFDCGHGVIDELANCGLRRVVLEDGPAALFRHPEDVLGPVFVRVLGVCAFGSESDQFSTFSLEGVGDVLEEDEAKDDVLVLRRIHIVAESVGSGPELGFQAIHRRGCSESYRVSHSHISVRLHFINFAPSVPIMVRQVPPG